MSQENVEIVRRLFEAADRDDADGAIAWATDDCVLDVSRRVLGGRTFEGHHGVREYFAMLADAWSDVRAEPEDFIPTGDAVVVPVRVVNTGRVSEITLAVRAAWVAEVREGKVARLTVYQSQAEAFEAVGLSE